MCAQARLLFIVGYSVAVRLILALAALHTRSCYASYSPPHHPPTSVNKR